MSTARTDQIALSVAIMAEHHSPMEDRWRLAGVAVASCSGDSKRLRDFLTKVRPGWLLLGEKLDDRQVERSLLETRRLGNRTRIALLGMPNDIERCERWIRNGIRCYLTASSTDEHIIQALNFSEREDSVVIDLCFQLRGVEIIRRLQPAAALSRREVEILRFVAEGRRRDEIASELHLTVDTVDFHFRNVTGKLGVRNRTEAVARAILLGLIGTVDSSLNIESAPSLR